MAGCMVRTVSFNIVRCIEGGMACRLWHLSMPCGMLFAARTVERRDIRSARIPVAVARGDPPPAKRDCATHTIAAAHPEANPLWIGRTTLTAPHSATAPALLRRSDRKGKRRLRPKPESEKRTSRCVGGESAGQCCVGPPSGASGAVHAVGSARRFPLSRALGATVAHRPGRCRAHAAARTVSGMR